MSVVAAVAGAVAVVGALILFRNDGVFTYTLDDVYIHLALARSIAAGHYGFNLAEVSSPSSSILFPFLLVPFVAAGAGTLAPLLIGTAALLATVYRVHRWASFELGASVVAASVISLAFAFGLNLVSIVFTGLEHSLQILLTVIVCDGIVRLAREPDTSDVGREFWVAVVCGPLVRYELLALSLPALALYAIVRGPGRALLAAAALAAPLVAFSAFLVARGQPWLPTSVIVHAGYADLPRRGLGLVVDVARNIIAHANSHAGAVMVMLALVASVGATLRPVERRLAVVSFAVLVAQLGFGQIGQRYELWALVALAMLALAAVAPLGWPAPVVARLVLPAACLALLGLPYLRALVLVPASANDVYRQQYQMGRLVQRLGVRSVAVNDIGLVGWMNPGVYVLDVVGLAAGESLSTRQLGRADSQWLDELANRHQAEVAMLYPGWFPRVPQGWRLEARIHLGRPPRIYHAAQATATTASGAAQARVGAFDKTPGHQRPGV